MAMTPEHTIRLADAQGSVLTGRAAAARIAANVDREVAQGAVVVVDFQGVSAVSPSFADELFGKLQTRVDSAQLRFVNLSDHLGAVARMAEQRRAR